MVAFADTCEPEAPSWPLPIGSAVAIAVEDDGTVADGFLLVARVCAEKQGRATFTGYITDNETGLCYARNRMYSPSLGRFIGRDKFDYISGPSLYEAYFVANDVDPWGNFPPGLIGVPIIIPVDLFPDPPFVPKPYLDEGGHWRPSHKDGRENPYNRQEYEKLLGPLTAAEELQFDRGCIGLVCMRQGRAGYPENPLPGDEVHCYLQYEKARDYECPPCTEKYVWAKQGFTKGGRGVDPKERENGEVDPGEVGQHDPKGRPLAGNMFNYASRHRGVWEWMNSEAGSREGRAGQEIMVYKELPRGSSTVYCVSCIKRQ